MKHESSGPPVRPTLALLAVVVLNWAVGPYPGGYSTAAVVLALAGTVLAVAACVLAERALPAPAELGLTILRRAALLAVVLGAFHFGREFDPGSVFVAVVSLAVLVGLYIRPIRCPGVFPALLAAAGLLLGSYAVVTSVQAYVLRHDWQIAVRVATAAAFVVQLSLIRDLPSWPNPATWFGPRLGLLFVCGAALRIGSILAAPQPIIDVYTALDEAPDHLLHGRNPYTASYSNPYESDLGRYYRIKQPPFSLDYPFYPPVPFLLALPFRVVGLDVRLANVVCDVLAALVLYLAALRRSGRLAGALLAGLYLNLPRVPFLTESGWYEPMIAALLGGGLLLLENSRLGGYVLLGLGLTAKQFGVVLLPALAWGGRKEWRWLVAGIALAGLSMLPFVLAGPTAFWQKVVVQHLHRPPVDSITLSSAAEKVWGVALPKPLLLAIALVGIGWVSRSAPDAGPGLGLWLGAELLIFILCHTQGYINYFYLAQYLLLLGVPGLLPPHGTGAAKGEGP